MRSRTLLLLSVALIVALVAAIHYFRRGNKAVRHPERTALARKLADIKFAAVGDFKGGKAVACMSPAGDLSEISCGFIGTDGNWIIEPRFVSLDNFSEGLAAAATGPLYRTPPEKDVYLAHSGSCKELVVISRGGPREVNYGVRKWGFIDETGKEATAFSFEDARQFTEGLGAVKKNGTWGFINKKGELAIGNMMENALYFNGGLAPAKLGGKWGYINKTGKFSVPPKFEEAGPFSEGLAPVREKELWGYIDSAGNFVIPAKYDEATLFADGVAVVKEGDKWGFMQKDGKYLLPPAYDIAGQFKDGVAVVLTGGMRGWWEFVDKTGRKTMNKRFREARAFGEGYAAVKEDGNWGYADVSGEFKVAPVFDGAGPFSEGKAAVRSGDRWGFISAPIR